MEMIVNALIDSGVQVLVALAVALIGVAGTWLTTQIGKVKQLQTVQIAVDEAKNAAITTALELQQTVVDDLKAAAVDGKLTKEEIAKLRNDLLAMSMAKLSNASVKVLGEGTDRRRRGHLRHHHRRRGSGHCAAENHRGSVCKITFPHLKGDGI